VNYRSRDGRTIAGDGDERWLLPAFAEMHRVLKDDSFAVSFYGWPKADRFLRAYRAAGFNVAGHFMFPKSYASTTGYVRYQHECAHLLVKGSPWGRSDPIGDVIGWKYSGNRLHPTQKPVEALLPLIEQFCPPGGLLLDPFAGSGSSLVAARMLGRRYLGIELDASYHAIASKRLATPSQFH
jgi:site-specific DNA-methyltransferase (adenine-specific)